MTAVSKPWGARSRTMNAGLNSQGVSIRDAGGPVDCRMGLNRSSHLPSLIAGKGISLGSPMNGKNSHKLV